MKRPAIIVRLVTSSWVGISPGAVHTYGRLSWREGDEIKELKLTHPMSAKEAVRYNKEMAERGFHSLKARPGQPTEDFENLEAVIRAAKRVAREKWKDNVWLIQGDSMSAQPILVWPRRFEVEAIRSNALAREWEQIGGYEGNERRAEEIDTDWGAIFSQVKGTI